MHPDPPHGLPVHALLPGLHSALAEVGAAVVVAPPGAGKTTAIPPALLGFGAPGPGTSRSGAPGSGTPRSGTSRSGAPSWLAGRKIVLLEPRRLAARAAAWRIASLLGEDDVGGLVGYRMRLETRVGPRTRIEVVTEGILTRMLQSDPSLEEVGALLFDEFHERSLHADLGLALALESRSLFRPDLRIVVMSATLDAAPVAELLRVPSGPGVPVLRSEGRTHPVETVFLDRPLPPGRPVEGAVAAGVGGALADHEGDVLVFLPGAAEIRRVAERLSDPGRLPQGVDVHVLHGSLVREAQDRALAPALPGRRKVVLASAVAETSLTIEGVRVVVDSGLMRIPRFDPGSGMTRLETVRVSRDTADQRRGRAGRTAPGTCYRLWTAGEDRGLVPHRTPEILEADLAPLVLELARWGADPGELRWIDPPPPAGLASARELLELLGLLDVSGALTPHGEDVSELGAHPRIGHLLVTARELGAGGTGCDLAALVGDRDPLVGEGRPADADLRLRLELLRSRGGGHGTPPGHRVDRGGVARARRESEQWARRLGLPARSAPRDDHAVGVLAAHGWPDRIGRHRGGGRYLLSGGKGAVLEESPALARAEWLVAVEVDGRGADVRIRQAAPLDAGELEEHLAHLVRTEERTRWSAEAGRVEAIRVRRLGAVELGRGPLRNPDPEAVAAALAGGIREAGIETLHWTKEARQLRARLAFLHHLEPEGWPGVSDAELLAGLGDWLLSLVPGARSPAELARVDLAEALLTRVSWEARRRLDALAPSHLEVPSGSRIALDYSDPETPVLAARIQELFGMTETPRIAGGRVPLVVHLLSPARRPVQVTRDLASFWREGYFDVRKDLRGRYPKHFWPDDPLTAPATRRVRPGPRYPSGEGGVRTP